MKKFIILLMVAMCSCAFPFAGGNGTNEDPYRISSAADLNAVNNDLSASYVLINDIDLSGVFYNDAVIHQFYGKFDGNGNRIISLRIDNSDSSGLAQPTGFFGIIDGGYVHDVGIVGCNISLLSGYSGALAGINANGTITNCYSTGDVNGSLVLTEAGAFDGLVSSGGLLGKNSGTIANCYSNCDVSGYYCGGLVCSSVEGANISNCYATGCVHTSGGAGLVALNSGNVAFCYSTGYINYGTAPEFAGGLIGINEGSVASSYWDISFAGLGVSSGGTGLTTVQMQQQSSYKGWDFADTWQMAENLLMIEYPELQWKINGYSYTVVFNAGTHGTIASGDLEQTIARGDSATAPAIIADVGYKFTGWDTAFKNVTTDLTVTAQYSPAYTVTFTAGEHGSITAGNTVQVIPVGEMAIEPEITPDSGWAFSGWDADLSSISEDTTVTALYEVAFDGGCGTKADPYRISTTVQLQAVNDDLAACYLLTSDIDLSGETYNDAVVAPDSLTSHTGFFTGTFDGGGHEIKGLNLSSSSRYCLMGFFGRIGDGADVHSLGITDCNLAAPTTPYGGALAGHIGLASITDCYSTGFVNSSKAGGLAGYNFGTISRSNSACTVNGSVSGGLIGYCGSTSSLSECYATGNVTGTSYCGGLVGSQGGNITNCYAAGSATGASYGTGGLIGIVNYGIIANCYATGAVSSGNCAGGLVGDHYVILPGYERSFVNCYWDVQTSGLLASDAGTGLTTAQMQTQSSFAGWDFYGERENGVAETWIKPYGGGYPMLVMSVERSADITEDGSVNAGDLSAISENWLDSGCLPWDFCAGADIDLNGAVNITDFAAIADGWLLAE